MVVMDCWLSGLFRLGTGFGRRHPCAADGAGIAAHLGNRGIIDRDAHIVNPGTSGSRDFPCRRDQPVANFARLDEGDVALRGDGARLRELQAKANAESASVKMKPPWAVP